MVASGEGWGHHSNLQDPASQSLDLYGNNSINDIDFAKDGTLVVAGTNDGLVYVWSTDSEENLVLETACDSGDWVHYVSLSYDAQYLALQERECDIEIIRLKDKSDQTITITPRLGYAYFPMAFSPAKPWLAAPAEKGIEIFHIPDLASIAELGNLKIGDAPPRFSDDGQLLAIADYESKFEVWNVNESRLLAHFEISPKVYEDGTIGISSVS